MKSIHLLGTSDIVFHYLSSSKMCTLSLMFKWLDFL